MQRIQKKEHTRFNILTWRTRRAQRNKEQGLIGRITDEIELIGKEIVDSAIKVHRTLGPGLLESAYQTCLAIELWNRSLSVDAEIIFPLLMKASRSNQLKG